MFSHFIEYYTTFPCCCIGSDSSKIPAPNRFYPSLFYTFFTCYTALLSAHSATQRLCVENTTPIT